MPRLITRNKSKKIAVEEHVYLPLTLICYCHFLSYSELLFVGRMNVFWRIIYSQSLNRSLTFLFLENYILTVFLAMRMGNLCCMMHP